MLPHEKFCAECTPKMCVSRIHLPVCRIYLKINFSLIEIERFRKSKPKAQIREFDLDVRYTGEYVARPLPHGGLDMIYNEKDGTMLSDQADFHFHDHGFEIAETFELDHEQEGRNVRCPLERNAKTFIGDVQSLTDKSGHHTYRTKTSGGFFNPVYKDHVFIGYSICEMLRGYDAVNGRMWSDEGYYQEMILRYTDKATKTADGIMFAGLQNENHMNFQDSVTENIEWCAGCRLVNGISGPPGTSPVHQDVAE